MATLVLMRGQGMSPGRQFPCDGDATSLGRQADCAVCLDDPAVSRKHARVLRYGDAFLIEDLGSSNGTYVNGTRIANRQPLAENDAVQIGPYVLSFRLAPLSGSMDPIVRSQVGAQPSNSSLFVSNAAAKLQVVIEIAQHLGRTIEVQPLLDKLLEQLFRLFPQAERALAILCDGENYVVRAQRQRHVRASGLAGDQKEADFPFSRSLVRRALEDGVGLLSEDVSDDPNISKSATLVSLNLRSFLCVPLIGSDDRRLGVLQLDCVREGLTFRHDDLELLTAVSLHVASVLENAALHEERLREERLKRELALAREIQHSFLPQEFVPVQGPYELFARCMPAREMSGDLYDFFPRPDGRLSLFLGDVSGKGMPSALFMIAVRTLIRHLSRSVRSPGQMLMSLNDALVADNPTSMFVTLVHAIYDPWSGEAVLACGGHPPPLLRRADGRTDTVDVQPTTMLGYDIFPQLPADVQIEIRPGDTLALYSDGLTEGFAPGRQAMYGAERLTELLADYGSEPLPALVERARKAVADFTRQSEQQDDQTLLLLRRM